MAIARHQDMTGVPQRKQRLRTAIEELSRHPQLAFATSFKTGDWFAAPHPARR